MSKRKREPKPELEWLLENQPTVYYSTNDEQKINTGGKLFTDVRIRRNDRVHVKTNLKIATWSTTLYTVVIVLSDSRVMLRGSGNKYIIVKPENLRLETVIIKGGSVKKHPLGFKF